MLQYLAAFTSLGITLFLLTPLVITIIIAPEINTLTGISL